MITIKRLERRFGGREILGGLDLEVGAGERVALHGANGSGKSTILRCVAGTLTPSGGEVHVGGYRAGSVAAKQSAINEIRRRILRKIYSIRDICPSLHDR